jgi:hypothetical protein
LHSSHSCPSGWAGTMHLEKPGLSCHHGLHFVCW